MQGKWQKSEKEIKRSAKEVQKCAEEVPKKWQRGKKEKNASKGQVSENHKENPCWLGFEEQSVIKVVLGKLNS